MRAILSLLVTIIIFSYNHAQTEQSSAQILHGLKKLQNTTRVLYLAAHPDDENTRMISWLENDRHIRTAYLSLTRGDGGQNLIGTELGAKLGVLRTQELMQARAIDGGEQFFTRAVDFGYSKNPDETFKQWDKDQVLSDVVWVIRKYQPDIIITRFPADARGGHGHHTASAMLGLEAFKLAADPEAYPEQLKYVQTWQVKRIFWNHSTWWRQNLDSIAQVDDDYSVVDVGAYNSLLGLSCNELASYSRSQHKSQGFGVSVARGSTKEYLQLLKGDKVQDDITDGIIPGWQRYAWSDGDRMLRELIEDFDALNPQASVAKMMDLMKGSNSIGNAQVRNWFQSELSELIASSLGLYAEVTSKEEFIPSSTDYTFSLNMISRAKSEVKLQGVSVAGQTLAVSTKDLILPVNERKTIEFELDLPKNISQPYWLVEDYQQMFNVKDQEFIGLPENIPSPEVQVSFVAEGNAFTLRLPIIYKFTDRVDGEVAQPMVVAPEVVVDLSKSNMIFTNDQSQNFELSWKSYDQKDHEIRLAAEGWQIMPSLIEVKGNASKSWQNIAVTVIPEKNSQLSSVLEVKVDDGMAMSMVEIDYPHIDKRVVFEKAQLNLVAIDLAKRGSKVGYIEGAGDMVPQALVEMGFEVEMLTKEMILSADLSGYQAIIAGIRAYNTQDWLSEVEAALFEYVENGGNYIVQYNTASRDLRSRQFGLYPFTLSRERVTEEDAEVIFLMEDHPVLNLPNQLSKKDFDNWVQERGLYFASDWDEAYKAPLGWHDHGEPMRAGGLIIADKGKGAYMYTGISFFRELPAGVPGAYRLLANLISYEAQINE